MIDLPNAAAIRAALRQPLPPQLHDLIANRLKLASDNGVADMTHILVVQPNDTEADIIEAIGFSPLVDPLSAGRFGTAEFQPYWAWLQDLGGWYELIHTVGNSGFAFILLIDKADGVLPELLRLCEGYADRSGAPCV